jgi:hypothetical protein
LDELAFRDNQGDERRANEDSVIKRNTNLFKKIIDLYTPHQIQWIIRIILKGKMHRPRVEKKRKY